MAEYLTNTTDLTKVAAAIREKGGTSDPLVYPDGFVTAIGNIQTGGTTPGSPGDITFYDYDGTIVTSWTLAELATKTALPDYPSHEGLTCQGWNWSLADLKTTNCKINVGAMYITDDGKTRIYIRLEEGRTSPMLGVCPSGTVTVDWGDGTTPDTLTGTSRYTVKWTSNHTYAAPGEYVIKLTVDGTMGFYGSASSDHSSILQYSSNKDNRNYTYNASVQKIEIGSNVTEITSYAFYYCSSLKSITIPNTISSIGTNTFMNCWSLKSIILPNNVTLTKYTFQNCYALKSIIVPSSIRSLEDGELTGCRSLASVYGITKISNEMFKECNSLTSITLLNEVSIIRTSAFESCYCLTSVVVPNSVTNIERYAFRSCYSVAFYDFSNHTSIPILNEASAFYGIAADCQIRVKASLYDTWKTASNWSTYADYIVPVGAYVSPIPNTYGIINNSKTVEIPLINYSVSPECTAEISGDSSDAVTIDNIQITTEKISLNLTLIKLGAPIITLTVTGEGTTYKRSFTLTVYETIPESTATVVAIDGAAYGFTLNSSGYYESQNKGVNSSYALCRVNISNILGKKLYFDCINYAEWNYDYGLLGAVNQELAKNSSADSGVKHSFKGKSQASIQTVEYDDATGECFIDVKFIKDSSGNNNNDTLQFKVRFEEDT